MKIGKFNVQVTQRRKDIIGVMIWTAVISLVMIKAHIILYQDPFFDVYGWAFKRYRPPSLGMLDMLILVAISVAITIILSDAKPIIYGFVSSLALSFIIAVTYVSLFVWYVLGWGDILSSQSAYGWEWALYLGFLNMFYVIPWVVGTCSMGLVIGIIARGWLMVS